MPAVLERPVAAPATTPDEVVPDLPPLTDDDVPAGGGEGDEQDPPPPDEVMSAPQATPQDLLAMQIERAAIFGEAIRRSRGGRVLFSDEFAKLSSMQLVAERISAKGIPASDPVCIFIEVCGLFDFRQRELVVAMGSLLNLNEEATKAFLAVIQSYMLEVQNSRTYLDRTNLRLDLTNKFLGDTSNRIDELGLFLRDFVRAAGPLADRLEVAADILETKSLRAVILNWIVPVVIIFLAIVSDRLLLLWHIF